MKLLFAFIIFYCGSAYSFQYYEKTRFDRSIHGTSLSQIIRSDGKQRIFTDNESHFTAYKDLVYGVCYLESLSNSNDGPRNFNDVMKCQKKVLESSEQILSKIEVFRLAGDRIVTFCSGTTMIMLRENTPMPLLPKHSSFNEIQIHEIDVFNPFNRENFRRKEGTVTNDKLNDQSSNVRSRRQISPFRRRFRGQTQSQYLQSDSDKQKEKGKAEAEATHQSTRAVVSGSSGMGQAQSMSSGTSGCDGCLEYEDVGTLPGSIIGPPEGPGPRQTGVAVGSIPIPGTYPLGGLPGSYTQGGTTGTIPGTNQHSQIVGTYHGGTTLVGVHVPDTYPKGTMRPGIIGGVVLPGGQISGTYPGGIIPSGGKIHDVYSDGTISVGSQQPRTYPAGTIQPGIVGGDTTGTIPGIYHGQEIPGTYPGGTIPSGGQLDGIYSGRILQPGTVTGGTTGRVPGPYPARQIPVTNPGSNTPSGDQLSVFYPAITVQPETAGRVITDTISGTYTGGQLPDTYLGGTISSTGQQGGAYPAGTMQPGTVGGSTSGMIPGTYPGRKIPGIYPGGSIPPGGQLLGTYPGGTVQHGTAGRGTTGKITGTYTSATVPPGGRLPGKYPDEIISGVHAHGTHPGGTISSGIYPSEYVPVIYPAVQFPGIYGSGIPSGISGDGSTVFHQNLIPSSGTSPGIGALGTYTGGSVQPGIASSGGRIIYPGDGQEYPADAISDQGAIPDSLVPGQVVMPAGVTPGVVLSADDGSDSQSISSVNQGEDGTQANANAEGKFGQGIAKSQVSGTYTGGGSFSAQAGTSDAFKSAQTEVSGGKEGANSSAQGSGGLGKSQTQVQLNSESGVTSTGAKTSGWNHGTNTQVQASGTGGMADAQANGEGQTSSQAQIGFQPYNKKEEKLEILARPFRGGGKASAQSGTYRGQSQSQLQGSFQYGVTYTGAAQAGSGSDAAASRKQFNFSTSEQNLFKPYKLEDQNTTTTDVPKEQELQTSSSSKQTVISILSKNYKHTTEKEDHSVETLQGEHSSDNTEEEEYEEYDDDYETSMKPVNSNKYKQVLISQEGDILHPDQSMRGYRIPAGFRGKVTSVSDETANSHDVKSRSHAVSLTPVNGALNRSDIKHASSDIRSLHSSHGRTGSLKNGKTHNRTSSIVTSSPRKNYFTVTNSVAGKMDDRNPTKQYEHRYYTKSSTCGYFTFSCNVVYGSNGRTKICKPRMPTNPDGTPMKC